MPSGHLGDEYAAAVQTGQRGADAGAVSPMSTSQYVYCEPTAWTALYNAPSFGFMYLWHRPGDGLVTVEWRRFGSDPPFYASGTVYNLSGQTTVWHGVPTAFVRLEVRPVGRPAYLMIT
jgi:hypothetical protein